jgi:putative ABC transport system ATP-binding protein
MSEIIKLKDVKKYYSMGGSIVKALDGIDLKVKKGDFIAIMGPSGSGKSTAMNLVGSLDTPTKGNIYLDKKDIAHLSESDLAQVRGRKIGFIFQQFNLIPNLTAKENIMLPMVFQEINEYERNKKAEELLKLVELEDRKNHYPSELSGGQQQRVAIARALANNPEVILADEPTGNLDTRTGEIVMKFLNKLNDEGKTIIIVTHDPDVAMEHAKIIYWIKDGKIEKITKKVLGKWKTLKKNEK